MSKPTQEKIVAAGIVFTIGFLLWIWYRMRSGKPILPMESANDAIVNATGDPINAATYVVVPPTIPPAQIVFPDMTGLPGGTDWVMPPLAPAIRDQDYVPATPLNMQAANNVVRPPQTSHGCGGDCCNSCAGSCANGNAYTDGSGCMFGTRQEQINQSKIPAAMTFENLTQYDYGMAMSKWDSAPIDGDEWWLDSTVNWLYF